MKYINKKVNNLQVVLQTIQNNMLESLIDFAITNKYIVSSLFEDGFYIYFDEEVSIDQEMLNQM